jgi:hypothetical protein
MVLETKLFSFYYPECVFSSGKREETRASAGLLFTVNP